MKKVTNLKLHEEFKLYENMWGDSTTNLKEGWDDQVAKADKDLDIIVNKTGNHSYDDGDGYWSGDDEWCNRYIYYSNSVANANQVKELCDKYSTDVCKFYVFEDDTEEDPVSEIGYTLTSLDDEDDDDLDESAQDNTLLETSVGFDWDFTKDLADTPKMASGRTQIPAGGLRSL